jgi:hypothetical protein
MKTHTSKMKYLVLLKDLQEQIDRRYKHLDSGLLPHKRFSVFEIESLIDEAGKTQPLPGAPVITTAVNVQALDDDWFNLNRLLDTPEARDALKNLCGRKRALTKPKEIAEFLGQELGQRPDDVYSRWTKDRCIELLAKLVALHMDSLPSTGPKNKGGRPKIDALKRRNQLVDEILRELKCTFADPRFWPTFRQRGQERFIPIPNRKGPKSHMWTELPGEESTTAEKTVLRQHRECREARNSALR